ncbi:MAG: HD domain-containing protein [Candidatus Omnitrophica bacterium]|nr:HD domain-containing protein [Candidatus Omnitrophota bacterium]
MKKGLSVLLLSSEGKERQPEGIMKELTTCTIHQTSWNSNLNNQINKYSPDVLIVTWRPEEKDLAQSITRLMADYPFLPVLVISQSFTPNQVAKLFHQGISDIILASQPSQLLPVISEAVKVAKDEQKKQENHDRLIEKTRWNDTLLHSLFLLIDRFSYNQDPLTAVHQRQVATLARSIARKMGLPEEPVYWSGLVHDIGKLSLPGEICSKTTILTMEERKIVETHCALGYEILEGINFPWPLAEIVLQHHERLDGSGYPRGLKGESILLEARVLAVADVVQAMSSTRPHRPSLGLKAALRYISQQEREKFDPKVVEACLKIFQGHY